MKRLLLGITLGLAIIGGVSASTMSNQNTETISKDGDEFNQGWEDGYCEGWKDVKGGYAHCPYPPYPPYPPYGKDHYRGGYNMGFKKGMRDAYND